MITFKQLLSEATDKMISTIGSLELDKLDDLWYNTHYDQSTHRNSRSLSHRLRKCT